MAEICIGCGKAFVRRQKAGKLQTYCSRSCYIESNRETSRQRTREWRNKNPKKCVEYAAKRLKGSRTINCKKCGKPVTAYRSDKEFCSMSCTVKYRREHTDYFRHAHEKNRERNNAYCMRHYHRTRAATPWKVLIEMAKVRGRKKGTPCDLTDAWAKARWTGKCEITGLPFEFGLTKRGPFSPSIDQIKQGQGYTQDNSRFVLWAINSFKNVGTDEQMYEIAIAITKAYSKYNAPHVEGMLSLPT